MKTKVIYISGGDDVAPAEIKSALDGIRKDLGLGADTVLFGLPLDAGEKPLPDHRVLRFPTEGSKKSILHVIKNSEEKEGKIKIADGPLVVDIEDADEAGEEKEEIKRDRSITEIMGDIPAMDEDAVGGDAGVSAVIPAVIPAKAGTGTGTGTERSDLAEEFGNFLENEPAEPSSAEKRPRPFGRKSKGPLNILGDLFSYAGMAANDDREDFTLPDFIKRP